MSDDLKPCPFCGSGGERKYECGNEVFGQTFFCGCSKCGIWLKAGGSNTWSVDKKRDSAAKLDVVMRWNTRAQQKPEQGAAGPVAWAVVDERGVNSLCATYMSKAMAQAHADGYKPQYNLSIVPLFTAPPAPDADAKLLDFLEHRQPIDMVLHCPNCGAQHIDAVENSPTSSWANPPHKSHLCAKCKYIWRPADVATNGVKFTKTRGKNDS